LQRLSATLQKAIATLQKGIAGLQKASARLQKGFTEQKASAPLQNDGGAMNHLDLQFFTFDADRKLVLFSIP